MPKRAARFAGLLLIAATAAVPASTKTNSGPDTASVQAECERARQSLRDGRAEDAARVFSGLLIRDPANVECMEGRVQALLAVGRWPDALSEARRFHGALPDDPRLRSVYGEALFRGGSLEEVGPLLAPLAARSDAPARALITLARLREAQGAREQSVGLMRRAVAAAPLDREVLYWASSTTATRVEAMALLERYLERSAGDDPDRVEAARGSLRMLAALADESIWVPEHKVSRLELPLQQLWDPSSGTIEGFVIQARLNAKGKPVRLLLDSGSPGLLVLERAARRYDFTHLADRTAFGGGGSGKQRSLRGFFGSFALGELKFRQPLATVTQSELDPTGRYHGLVGLSIFHGYHVTLDLGGKRLVLEASQAMLDGVPYWIVEGQLLVSAREGGGRQGLFLLDTGHTRTLLSRRFIDGLASAKLGDPVVIHSVGGRLPDARALSGVEVWFQGRRAGPRDLRASDLSLRSRLAGVEVSGFLGLDLLAGAAIELDTREQRIRVSDARGR